MKIQGQKLEILRKEFDEFVFIVSHDVKAPLRAITNLTHWIEEDLAYTRNEEDILENFSMLKERVKRMEDMIDSLGEYSRIHKENLTVYKQNVFEFLDRVTNSSITCPNIQINKHYEISNPIIETNFGKLERIIKELIENSIRFANKSTITINIRALEDEDFYVFQISDNGCGIPKEVRDKIFKIFYTVRPKDIFYSTGAGLAICKKICQFVGGDILYIEQENEGACFEVKWPKNNLINDDYES